MNLGIASYSYVPRMLIKEAKGHIWLMITFQVSSLAERMSHSMWNSEFCGLHNPGQTARDPIY